MWEAHQGLHVDNGLLVVGMTESVVVVFGLDAVVGIAAVMCMAVVDEAVIGMLMATAIVELDGEVVGTAVVV